MANFQLCPELSNLLGALKKNMRPIIFSNFKMSPLESHLTSPFTYSLPCLQVYTTVYQPPLQVIYLILPLKSLFLPQPHFWSSHPIKSKSEGWKERDRDGHQR